MKTRTSIIIIIVLTLIGSAGWGLFIYQFHNSDKRPIKITWTGPTVTKHDKDKPGYVERDIEITGKQRDKYVDIEATDGYNTGYRTMELDIKPIFPKWTLKLGILGGAGYMPELKRIDAILGADLELFRHFKQFAVGGGIWYTQGATSEFKAGGIRASLLCSFK